MFKVHSVAIDAIAPLRSLHLQEMNCQVRYDACHSRGWADHYLVQHQQQNIGYGAVKGLHDLAKRNTLFEVYILPQFRTETMHIVHEIVRQSNVCYMEAQSNDALFSPVVKELCSDVTSDKILFQMDRITSLSKENVQFRKKVDGEDVFGKKFKDQGAYVLQYNDTVVADGGFLLHYNFPYADLYMETAKEFRQQGFGSLIIQELIKECFLHGRIPAARCNSKNIASQKTLTKGGLKKCGEMLSGKIKT